ncbi:GGDEF domain-containing protein [Novosphingobium sp. G106]|uniref:GGDEF domain-containing protein n=1 Tax=Novosphingobium sp. G106 TaxID=2849500 RepID=UPI001C2D7AD1|nr:GGDEF domain-containing protein [Novosphingobium sp. G106]MBV1689034.1 GGDEF domain-containing protein [Novosphingobium sp. G106]
MSENDGKSKGILRWLGLGAAPSEDGEIEGVEVAQPAPEPVESEDPRERRRKQLLTDIGSFLLTHRLEVNSFTLAIAHDVLTGADPKLARLLEERVISRQPVSMHWLEDACRSTGRNDGVAQLDALMTKLEHSIQDFGQTTVAAKSAASDYNSALEQHVNELEQVSKAGVVITELANIARLMLDRTREIEKEMSRSEIQTRSLQRSLEEARRSAELDHLTGLPNRRAFEGVLERETAAAIEASEPMCVAICDIDHFKRVNDTHGHEAGDRVIRAVAQTLAKISNEHCHVARHGGEEFVVLFRGKTIEEAWQVLDEAREAMAERRLVNRATDIPFGRITFSGGIADVLSHTSPRDAMKAADDALYAAKAAGRNLIVKAGEQARAAA